MPTPPPHIYLYQDIFRTGRKPEVVSENARPGDHAQNTLFNTNTIPSRARARVRGGGKAACAWMGRHQRPPTVPLDVFQLTAGCPKDDHTISTQHVATLPTPVPSEPSP